MKRVLTLGPGESTMALANQLKHLKKDIDIFGMHRVFPYLKQTQGIDIKYWTWGDPHAAIEGLMWMKNNPNEKHPQIILPWWHKSVSVFTANAGSTPLTRSKNKTFYDNEVAKLEEEGKLVFLENAVPTKKLAYNHPIFLDPTFRFKDEVVFGSVPFDGQSSESNWAQENKFTSVMLPISYYLGYDEVYCLGFDNRGTGINRVIPQSKNDPRTIAKYLEKITLWTRDWKDIHKIKIFSVIPDKYSPNNTVMDYTHINNILTGVPHADVLQTNVIVVAPFNYTSERQKKFTELTAEMEAVKKDPTLTALAKKETLSFIQREINDLKL